MTIQEAKLFFRNYKNYETIFPIEILEKAFSIVDVKRFQTKTTVRCKNGNDNYYQKQGYPETGRGQRTFKEYKGEWSREVRDFGIDYLTPDNYQLEEKTILKFCLLEMFPYLNDFDFPVYHFDNSGYNEIYIQCENGKSLYVPVAALLKNDKNAIIKRMNDYFRWYYKDPDRKEYLEKELSTLETETCKKLFDILDSGGIKK